MYTSALKLTCSPLLKLKWSKENSALRVADKQPKKLRDPFSGPLKHHQRRSVESNSVFVFHIRWGVKGQFHRESGEPCIRAFNIGKLSDHDLLSASLKAECHPLLLLFFLYSTSTLHKSLKQAAQYFHRGDFISRASLCTPNCQFCCLINPSLCFAPHL